MISRTFGFIAVFLLSVSGSLGQTTSVGSDTVNNYAVVTAIDYTTGIITVASPAGFTLGDRVLLIEMKGASSLTSPTASFGQVVQSNGVGLYEMGRICELTGNSIRLQHFPLNTYGPISFSASSIQLIRVPEHPNIEVTSTLSAPAWDGSTGGVLVMEATGKIKLSADIDLSGVGFRGASNINSTYSCSFTVSNSDYFYSQVSTIGGLKGEGISRVVVGTEGGRGPLANGGGGGNDHNSGGAGGGHYNLGGNGGETSNTGLFSCTGLFPGLGGLGLASYGYSLANNRVFLGGGGGAGHGNNGETPDAGNGGGIIILICDTLDGNGFSIRSDGITPADAGSDGGSGGGAGGSIMLQNNVFTNPLTLSVIGGDGGMSSTIAARCMGPGGGGAGGVIWSGVALPGSITTSLTGGAAGILDPTNLGLPAGCQGATNGSLGGSVGAAITGLLLAEETANPNTSCVLPSGDLTLEIQNQNGDARLTGIYTGHNALLEISLQKRSGGNWASIAKRRGVIADLKWLDPKPKSGSFYRLIAIDVTSREFRSNMVEWVAPPFEGSAIRILGNPVVQGEPIRLAIQANAESQASYLLRDAFGREIRSGRLKLVAGENFLTLQRQGLARGSYFIEVFLERAEVFRSVVVLQ